MATGAAVTVAMCAGVVGGLSAYATEEVPSGTVTQYAAIVRVNDDGTLTVSESATYDFVGEPRESVQRTISTREHYDAEHDREYGIDDVTVSAEATEVSTEVSADEEETTIDVSFAEPQTASVAVQFEYVVSGAVAQTVDGLEVRWPVVQGFESYVNDITVEWNAQQVIWVSCLAGSPGSSQPCTTAQTAETPNPVMTQESLAPGQQLVGLLGLDAAAPVDPTAELVQRWSLDRAFTSTGLPLMLSLCLLALGVLAALGLWWTRGRDTGADEDAGPVSPFVPDGDRVVFAPPGAVRPGQMGTLVDEHADIIDVSSTVIDLAVRNYVFIEELPHGEYGRHDWILRRRHIGGDELLAYEREVLDGLFSEREQVTVSEIGDALRTRLAAIQGHLYEDAVDQGWFAERPDAVRNRWTTAGWVMVVTGIVLTGVLALASRYGLVGLAVTLAGVALVAAGQAAPARTARGSRALAQLRHFRDFLETADTSSLPHDQREEMLSRCYPYALVFGLGDRWAAAIAGLDEDAEPDEPMHWYGAPQNWHLSDAAPSLLHLSTALGGAIASRRLLGD
jgi:uncharacterized protein (TIGR04222 family)